MKSGQGLEPWRPDVRGGNPFAGKSGRKAEKGKQKQGCRGKIKKKKKLPTLGERKRKKPRRDAGKRTSGTKRAPRDLQPRGPTRKVKSKTEIILYGGNTK